MLLASGRDLDIKAESKGKTAVETARSCVQWQDEKDHDFERRRENCPAIATLIDEFESNPEKIRRQLREELGLEGFFCLLLYLSFLFLFKTLSLSGETEKVRALRSYQAKMPHELSFSRGDVMVVHQRFFGGSLWEAELPDGTTGFVPCNLVVSYFEGDDDFFESKNARITELEGENEVLRRMVHEKSREIQVAKAATLSSTTTVPAVERGSEREEGGAAFLEEPQEGTRRMSSRKRKASATEEQTASTPPAELMEAGRSSMKKAKQEKKQKPQLRGESLFSLYSSSTSKRSNHLTWCAMFHSLNSCAFVLQM